MTTPASALACLTTSLSSITYTVKSTDAAGSTVTVTAVTTTPVVSCMPGLFCQESNGITTCMVRQDNLTTGGIVVSIIFGAAVIGFIATIITMCCRSQGSARPKLAGHAPLPVTPKVASTLSKPRPGLRTASGASDANLPLMSSQGPGGMVAGPDSYSTEYKGASARQPSSAGGHQDVPVASRAPQLHPGLSGMDGYGQDVGYGNR